MDKKELKGLEEEIRKCYGFINFHYNDLPLDKLHGFLRHYKEMQKLYRKETGVYCKPKDI